MANSRAGVGAGTIPTDRTDSHNEHDRAVSLPSQKGCSAANNNHPHAASTYTHRLPMIGTMGNAVFATQVRPSADLSEETTRRNAIRQQFSHLIGGM